MPPNTLSKSPAQQQITATAPLTPIPKSFQPPPGRTALRVEECAKILSVDPKHIVDLIEEGKIVALNVGGHTRKFYRIPVDAWETYVRKNLV